MRAVRNIEDRFMEKVMPVTEMPGCWIWDACRLPSGYGKFGIGRRTFLAHRISYQLFRGPVPDHICVLHRCDLPCCVNPGHLFLGTNADNTQDMIDKGRLVSPLAKRSCCKHGHAYSQANTRVVINSNGTARYCRTCERTRQKLYKSERANGNH